MATEVNSSLRTGWVVIATEGDTVDGRQIPAQWIVDMAETYDEQNYRALIWPEHFRWGANMGDVIELKHEKVKGKETLFAVLSPTRDLVYYNSINQYKFCSIEPEHDFAGTGRTYLIGLGVTSQPASLGTTALRFSAANSPKIIGQSHQLDLSGMASGTNKQAPEPTGLMHQFFNYLARHGDAIAPTRQEPDRTIDEDDDMKEEQFSALNDTLKSIGDKFAGLSTKLDEKFAAVQPTKVEEKPEITAEQPTKVEEKPGITAEQFAKLEQTLTGITDKVGSLQSQIEKFSVEVPGQRPGDLGGDDTPTVY